MRVVGVFPKQIIIGLEFTAEDLALLKLALDNTTLNLDLNNPKHQQAEDFVLRELYPMIAQIGKDLEEVR